MSWKTRWGRVGKTNAEGLARGPEDRRSAIMDDRVRYPRWTLAMVDAAPILEAKGRKWFQLYDKIADRRTLTVAWERIDRRTKGAARTRGAGPDGMTVEDFAGQNGRLIEKLEKQMKAGKYRPDPVRRHMIPKPGSKTGRPLGLPTIIDRIVQEATRGVMEPVYELRFYESSHGFRPGKSTDSACRQLEHQLSQGRQWVVDADIKGCFDNIPHKTIVDIVADRISDGKVLRLVEGMLKAGVIEQAQLLHPTAGTPQGGIISPLLCNIVLHEMDSKLEQASITWVRYADDFVLLCNTREEAEAALETAAKALSELGLELNSEKTRIVHLEEGFDFLGWHYKGQMRWPREKSVKALKAKLKIATKRNRPGSMKEICSRLAPQLRGWYNYYRNGNSAATFKAIDSWLRRRLRSILHNRRKSHSGISSLLDNMRWPNSYFERNGLFSLRQEHIKHRHRITRHPT